MLDLMIRRPKNGNLACSSSVFDFSGVSPHPDPSFPVVLHLAATGNFFIHCSMVWQWPNYSSVPLKKHTLHEQRENEMLNNVVTLISNLDMHDDKLEHAKIARPAHVI